MLCFLLLSQGKKLIVKPCQFVTQGFLFFAESLLKLTQRLFFLGALRLQHAYLFLKLRERSSSTFGFLLTFVCLGSQSVAFSFELGDLFIYASNLCLQRLLAASFLKV
ncbi:hypothetical protein ES703_20133 [subsurface metagenome]